MVKDEKELVQFTLKYVTYISMKTEPKGRTPPANTMKLGSINHFFSGICLGTGFTLQGGLGVPETFLPNTAPTMDNGRMMNRQMAAMAIMLVKGMALALW